MHILKRVYSQPPHYFYFHRDDTFYLLPAYTVTSFTAQKGDLCSLTSSRNLKFAKFSMIQLDTSSYVGILCFQPSMRSMSSCHLDYYIARETNYGWLYIKYTPTA